LLSGGQGFVWTDNFMKKSLYSAIGLLLFVLLMLRGLNGVAADGPAEAIKYAPPVAQFAVLSDPHVHDPSLGMAGRVFAARHAHDVKLVRESGALFEQAMERLLAQDPKPAFVLIPGDLTHDGEAASHRRMASYLAELRGKGIQPYVIPGNHDVDNPQATRYDRNGAHPAQRVGAREFARLYDQFGYRQAIARDPHSLSYVAEPVAGYWLFAIDSSRYGESNAKRIDTGRIRAGTLKWLLGKLDEARRLGKQTLGMMHHGIVEHSLGQASYFTDFVVEDWDRVGQQLARSGLNLVFTGHTHTQNITRKVWRQGEVLLDVQTGSLVSYPNPLRFVALDARRSRLMIQSQRITQLPAGVTGDLKDFANVSRDFAAARQHAIVTREMQVRSSLPASSQAEFTRQIVLAVMASYAGDERPTLRQFDAALILRNSTHPDETAIGNLLLSLWHDLPPDDNTVDLALTPKLRPSAAPALKGLAVR